MGKFADFNIKNNTENTNVSQSNNGGYNVQNTQVINNRTINNHYTKQNSNGDGDAGAFIAGAVILTIGIGFVIWSFFTYYQEIYPILKTGALFSPVFSIIGIIALVLRKEVETTDFVRFFFLVLAGGSVFLLNEYLNINVPLEIIDLIKTSHIGFRFLERIKRIWQKPFFVVDIFEYLDWCINNIDNLRCIQRIIILLS
ncbi:hypothetical protein ACI2AF_003712 [Escherichia coli]